MGPSLAPFRNFFIIHPRKKHVNQNDVEFDFSIGHALVFFCFLNNKQKKGQWNMYIPPVPSKFIYIDTFWSKNIVFTKSHDNYHGYL